MITEDAVETHAKRIRRKLNNDATPSNVLTGMIG